jgi:hypothetical protein
MRKINENDYIEFTFKGNGFSVTANFKFVMNTYNEAAHGTVYGRKPNGDVAIIDQK